MNFRIAGFVICILSIISISPVPAAQLKSGDSQHFMAPKITILSTMVANYLGVGEWGFSALLETQTESILFDTGFKPRTVLKNAQLLNKDLSKVEKVILSHFHTDHTGGLLTLRERLLHLNPRAMSTVYVGKGFFEQRYREDGSLTYSLTHPDIETRFDTPTAFRTAAEEVGIQFVILDAPKEISPNIFVTGPIKRTHHEPNVSPGFYLRKDKTLVPDHVPESQSLGVLTEKGWLLLTGCGHAGVVNAAEALRTIHDRPLHLGVGGLHLFRASNEQLQWTAKLLGQFGLKKIVGAHCTGAHATATISQSLHLPRESVSIGAVGTTIDSDLSIHPASID